jgi:hypothetical protein
MRWVPMSSVYVRPHSIEIDLQVIYDQRTQMFEGQITVRRRNGGVYQIIRSLLLIVLLLIVRLDRWPLAGCARVLLPHSTHLVPSYG